MNIDDVIIVYGNQKNCTKIYAKIYIEIYMEEEQSTMQSMENIFDDPNGLK